MLNVESSAPEPAEPRPPFRPVFPFLGLKGGAGSMPKTGAKAEWDGEIWEQDLPRGLPIERKKIWNVLWRFLHELLDLVCFRVGCFHVSPL